MKLELFSEKQPICKLTSLVNEMDGSDYWSNLESELGIAIRTRDRTMFQWEIANGFLTEEDIIRILDPNDQAVDLRGSSMDKKNGIVNWREYLNSSVHAPIFMRDISIGELASLNKKDPISEIDILPNHLKEIYLRFPQFFQFRTFIADSERVHRYGDYKSHLLNFGIDFDLSQGWTGIWVRQTNVYGMFLNRLDKVVTSESVAYILVYFDSLELLNAPGFYDEGALNFINLVKRQKTLRDLLLDGCIIRIGEENDF